MKQYIVACLGLALALTYASHPVTASPEPKSLGERQYIAGVDYPAGSSRPEDGAGCPDGAQLRNLWRSDDCKDDPWMCQEEIGNIYFRAEENIRRAGRNEAFALAKAALRPGGKIIVVRKGDSFSSLFGRDWRRIADLNGYEATWKYRLGKLGQEPKTMITDRNEQEVGLRLQEGDVLFVPPQGWKLATTPHSALHAAN